MRVDIITIFPRMFEGVLSESMLKIAQEKAPDDALVAMNLADEYRRTGDKVAARAAYKKVTGLKTTDEIKAAAAKALKSLK